MRAAKASASSGVSTSRESVGRDVLLVERFDRGAGGTRRLMVSASTILGLPEHGSWAAASCADLADEVRARFTDPVETWRELFTRIVFNTCVSNTDDHPRNHAAYWDGSVLSLTPAYDLCPQPRTGGFAAQAMAIGRDGDRTSRLATCVAAADVYLLSRAEAGEIVDRVTTTILEQWDATADEVHLHRADREQLRQRQILNPAIFESDP